MSADLDWYLPDPKGIEPIGPFKTEEISLKIKSKEIAFDYYISCPEIAGEKWVRVYEFSQFKSLMIHFPICPAPKAFSKGIHTEIDHTDSVELDVRKDAEGFEESKNILEEMSVLIHDNDLFFSGNVISLSDLDVMVMMGIDQRLRKGNEYNLTIVSSKLFKTFTTPSVITSIEKEDGMLNVKFHFLRINPNDRRDITEALHRHLTNMKVESERL
jgi:hypothetical protein